MRVTQIVLIVAFIVGLSACKGREPVAAPAPAPEAKAKAERDDASASASTSAESSSWGDEQSYPEQYSDPSLAAGEAGGYPQTDPYATGQEGGMPGGAQLQPQQQQSDPLAAVMPQLIQCFTNDQCDPEQAVMSLPPQTQQLLMSAAQQYESTGGGPLAPYAAQAQAAGIDLSELMY
jgi:hypothetical protein